MNSWYPAILRERAMADEMSVFWFDSCIKHLRGGATSGRTWCTPYWRQTERWVRAQLLAVSVAGYRYR